MAGPMMGGTYASSDALLVLIYATKINKEEVLKKASQLYSRVVMLLLTGEYETIVSNIEAANVGSSTLKKHTVFTRLLGTKALPDAMEDSLRDAGFSCRYYATQRQRTHKTNEIDIRVRHQRVLRHTERKISPNELEEIQL